MIKKFIGLLVGMLVMFVVYVVGVQLCVSYLDIYMVCCGDMLWDILVKFFFKFWLWLEIWQVNLQVQNLYLIYLGDVFNLFFINGFMFKLELGVYSGDEVVLVILFFELGMFFKDMWVMKFEDVSLVLYVVGMEEVWLCGILGQNFYVCNLQVELGQCWVIVCLIYVFCGFEQDDKSNVENEIVGYIFDVDVFMVCSLWLEDFCNDGYYGCGEDLGVEVLVIGMVEMLCMGDVLILLLFDFIMEICKGDCVMLVDDYFYDVYFYLYVLKLVVLYVCVIVFVDVFDVVGKCQVVVLLIGKQDGVENGQIYVVWQLGEIIVDDVVGNSWCCGILFDVILLEEFVGYVMVFCIFDCVSYGLIMDSLWLVYCGDNLCMFEQVWIG